MHFKSLFVNTLIVVSLITNLSMVPEKKYHLLCLGDSYTIGEAVSEDERFPMQTAELLKKAGISTAPPVIIARTGWTTDELQVAIANWESDKSNHFKPGNSDVIVTLLIGVNNEFRGRDTEEYRKEFGLLLQKALHYTEGNAGHVFVLSIPDWGVTPFAGQDPKHRTSAQIGAEIDVFNKINKEEALKANVHYLDITPISREATINRELLAKDGLHPSGKMYTLWAKLLTKQVQEALK